jgi:hypothetical protein
VAFLSPLYSIQRKEERYEKENDKDFGGAVVLRVSFGAKSAGRTAL